MNLAEVWSESYDLKSILNDFHSYKNCITRIKNRLLRHNFPKNIWSGTAMAGLISSEPIRLLH